MTYELTATITLFPSADLGSGTRHFVLQENFRPTWIYAGPGAPAAPPVLFFPGQSLAAAVAAHLANSGQLTELTGITAPVDGREMLELTDTQEVRLCELFAGRPTTLLLLPGTCITLDEVARATTSGWVIDVVDRRDVEVVPFPSPWGEAS